MKKILSFISYEIGIILNFNSLNKNTSKHKIDLFDYSLNLLSICQNCYLISFFMFIINTWLKSTHFFKLHTRKQDHQLQLSDKAKCEELIICSQLI